MSSMNVRLCVLLRGVREWLDSGGPAEWRPEIERQLYLAISGGRYQTALPNALSDVSAELLRSGEKFPERLRVDDSTARKLFAEGLGVLSDHELARLSWSQGELAVLRNLFGDADGYSDDWFLVWETATEEERQQCDPAKSDAGFNQLVQELKDEKRKIAVRSQPSSRKFAPRKVLTSLTALAASILFGVLLGRNIYHTVPEVAKLKTRFEPISRMGIPPPDQDRTQLRVIAPENGFVTLFCLAPDAKQHVRPRLDHGDIMVTKDQESAPIEIPSDTTRVLVVFSRQPSGNSLRTRFEGQDATRYTAKTVENLQRDVVEYLQSQNIEGVFTSIAEVSQNP